MFKTLKLLLPALIPSWRFFDTVAASPRIEFSRLNTAQDSPAGWQEFRPRPLTLSPAAMLSRLLWNPRWNESLFLVSCAERLMENGEEHSAAEIAGRIKAGLAQNADMPFLQFRLVFVSREGEALERQVTYVSKIYGQAESPAP